jgi:hypothetical protein
VVWFRRMNMPTVVAARLEDLRAQRPHLEHGAIFLPELDPPLEMLTEVLVRTQAPSGESIDVPARVVQGIPGQGMAIAFDDRAAALGKLLPALDAPVAPADKADVHAGSEANRTGDAPTSTANPDPAKKLDETAVLHAQVEAMTLPQKINLALHGNSAARQLLLRDVNKTLQAFVLQNSRITIDEVRWVAGYRQAAPDVLASIANNREWVQNPNVVSALVRNPRTPSTVAVKLLDRLPVTEIRRLAKSSDVPRAVSAAARKRIAED